MHKVYRSSGPMALHGFLQKLSVATVGIFQGFVLIDLAFDVESLRGKFSSSKPFYQGREEHPALDRLALLQAPLLLALLSTVYVAIRDRSWQNWSALVLLLAAMFGGSNVVKLRDYMKEHREEEVVHPSLVNIAWIHVLMSVALGLCLFLLCLEGSAKDKSA
ncbi:unnamed protein product [Effrenium voratum]|nr:unnamed protein product [Effrenium voratum]